MADFLCGAGGQLQSSSPPPVGSEDERVSLGAVAAEVAAAGQALIASSTSPRIPRQKELAGDVVTEVDQLVERALRSRLEGRRPGDRVIGEELPATGSGATGIEWYLDPIDGTTNFVVGAGPYCTSVAAYDSRRQRWLAAAVATASGEVYSAVRGLGATVCDDTGEHALRAVIAAGAPRLLGTGLSYDPDVRSAQLIDLSTHMNGHDDMRSYGTAAYGLCLVARGVLHTFIETDLFVYDWAAGALIAEEAGAQVVRPGLRRGAVSAVGALADGDLP